MSINGHNPHNNTARWALLSNLVCKVDVFPNKISPKPTQLVPLSSKAVPNAPCPLTSHYYSLPKGTSCVSGPAAGPTYSVTCQCWAKQHLDCAPASIPGRNKPCMATGQKKQCWNLCVLTWLIVRVPISRPPSSLGWVLALLGPFSLCPATAPSPTCLPWDSTSTFPVHPTPSYVFNQPAATSARNS